MPVQASAHPSPRRRPGQVGGRVADRGDGGSASVELVVLFPALIALIFVTVQAGLYFYARSVALAAAQEGARAGAVRSAAPDEGRAGADAFLSRVPPGLLDAALVSVRRTATRISVTVTGTSPSLVPGFAGFPVRQTAAAALERVT